MLLVASELAPSLVMSADDLHADGINWCGMDWCDHYHDHPGGEDPDHLPAHLVLDGDTRVYIQGNVAEFRTLCARVLAALPTSAGLALIAGTPRTEASVVSIRRDVPPLRLVTDTEPAPPPSQHLLDGQVFAQAMAVLGEAAAATDHRSPRLSRFRRGGTHRIA